MEKVETFAKRQSKISAEHSFLLEHAAEILLYLFTFYWKNYALGTSSTLSQPGCRASKAL